MRVLTFALYLLATPALDDAAGVASVIDGDTIEVHGQRIRLHGIDAPESRQLCRLDGKPWQCGKDAANALADKIARRPVTSEDVSKWMVATFCRTSPTRSMPQAQLHTANSESEFKGAMTAAAYKWNCVGILASVGFRSIRTAWCRSLARGKSGCRSYRHRCRCRSGLRGLLAGGRSSAREPRSCHGWPLSW